MKKYINFILLCLVVSWANAQKLTIKDIESRLITNQGIEFVGDLKDADDFNYVFPTWKNYAILYVKNEQYVLNNINLNMETNSFESRINKNQLFSYRKSSLDSISINSKLFKKIGSSFYEVLCEKENNQFLKKYDIVYEEGKASRLGGTVGRSKSRLAYKYLLVTDDNFRRIELNKKSITDIFKEDKDALEDFVKNENLSYKKEKDIVRIFNHMLSI